MQWVTTTQVLEDLRDANDAMAWEQFRDHFYPIVSGFARRMGLSEANAEDAAQETMMAFLKAFRDGRYDRERGHLSNWLFGLAKRVLLDFRKRLKPELLIADRTSGTSFWNAMEDEDAVRNTWTTEWRRMVLARCVEKVRREMDPRVFEAFELYALSETPVEQVAEKLNMTRNAVYIAKSRVLSRLRELEQEFERTA
jgi:RNA polymerase sigma-70 factor (ECF subfamily)